VLGRKRRADKLPGEFRVALDEKEQSASPLGRAREPALGWCCISGMRCSRLCFSRVFQSLPPAKSFVFPRWPNFHFPAPISYLGECGGLLSRTVVRISLAVQSGWQKRCGSRVGKLVRPRCTWGAARPKTSFHERAPWMRHVVSSRVRPSPTPSQTPYPIEKAAPWPGNPPQVH
jgi:hypothetical protein